MGKFALLIGVSEYVSGLQPLPKAVKDVDKLEQILSNPEIGGFEKVEVLRNPDRQEMATKIYEFFSHSQKNDLLLFYFSGHGIVDEQLKFYLSSRSTQKDQNGRIIPPTAVSATEIHGWMSTLNCKSKRQAVILDCCNAGAFAKGLTTKDVGRIDIKAQLGGEGRAVLTAATSTQYAFEQEGLDLSIYTNYLVEGLEKGAADLNGDGQISVDELHEYVFKKVKEAAPAMTPEIYNLARDTEPILIARSPKDDPKLAYRKEVERRASRGDISSLGRRILEDLRDNLALSAEEANAIEEEVLKPYREYQKKLQRYEQAFAEVVRQENSISEATREELFHYQELLGLRKQDILPIEGKYLAQAKDAVKPQSRSTDAVQPEANFPGLGIGDFRTPSPPVGQNSQPASAQHSQKKIESQQEPAQNRQTHTSSQSTRPKARTPSDSSTHTTGAFLENKESSKKKSGWLVSLGVWAIVIPILSAIALPSFLNQANKARQSEAKTYVGSINRGQQAFFIEQNQFSSDLSALGLDIPPETTSYSYNTQAHNSEQNPYAIATATPKQERLKSYVGGVFVTTTSANELTTVAILCESTEPSTNPPDPPKLVGSEPQCAPGSTDLAKLNSAQ